MENNNRLNQQNIPPSTPTGAPLINKRTLHRDDDLLPYAHNSPDIYSKFSSNKPSKFSSNITKRHLAGATNTANNYEDIVNLYGSMKTNKNDKNHNRKNQNKKQKNSTHHNNNNQQET